MRAKSMAMLMLALGCGLVASIGITQVMAKRNAEPAPTGETQPIFIAVKDIPQGEHLTAEVLKLENWPKDKVPLGAISKIEDLDACRTRTKLYAGEPILDKKLFGKGSGAQSDTILIPKGYRGVPVKVDSVSGGPGLIMPGDRVDVLVHLVRNTNLGIPETTTRTVLQNIKVFAVNDVVDVEKDKDSNSKDKPKAVQQTISLLVTPAQGAMLTLASEMGKIRLIMRSSEDDTIANDGKADPGDLLGTSQKGEKVKERLYVDDTPAALKGPSKLTSFLQSMKNQLASKAKIVVPGIANETYSMRILQPNSINDVVLEADGSGPHAAKMPNATWHIANTYMTSVTSGASSAGNTPKTPSLPPAPNPKGAATAPPPDPAADSDPTPNPNINNAPSGKPVEKAPQADPPSNSAEETNAMIGD
jgi:pilus assembly protein CpaB